MLSPLSEKRLVTSLKGGCTVPMTSVSTAVEPGPADRREPADRVLGGWLGRIAGNMLGKPAEQGQV